MMTVLADLTGKERRRALAKGLGIAILTTIVLIAAYFLLPLDDFDTLPRWVVPVFAPVLLVGVTVWQIQAIPRARMPGIRAIQALAIIAPLYILLFAAGYFVMSQADPSNFSVDGLTRVDTLYFTVTIFSTVGFGDITAASQLTRIVVTVQMILNLVILGAGVRLLTGAVKKGREAHAADSATGDEQRG